MKKRIEEKLDNGSIVVKDDDLSDVLEDIISGTMEDIDISRLSKGALENLFGQFDEADKITKDYQNFYTLVGQTVKSANVLTKNYDFILKMNLMDFSAKYGYLAKSIR